MNSQNPPMDAPPHAVYSSLEELVSASNAHAQGQGYKLVVVRSKTNAQNQKTWVQLACDRHGTKRNTHNLTDETRKKNRRSRRCECPMFCVASRTASGLWELSVRNPEHNHGPYEATSAIKNKRKNAQPQHSSELVNLPLLQTPSNCIADFCLIPIGGGSPSVSGEVAEIQRLLKRSGLTFEMHSAGTTVEGPWQDVMRIIGQAHSLLHGNGILRIQTDIRVGTRTDKKQTARDKVRVVEALLNNETIDRAEPDDTMHDDTEMTADATPSHLRHTLPPNLDPQISNLEQMIPPPPHMQMPPTMNHHPMAPHLTHRLPPNLPFSDGK